MCGFVCLWRAGDAALARRMIDKIAHRGPDELQVSQLPGVPAVMAHCRLAIIGAEAGTQPIWHGDHVLIANGEIYNYAALRRILRKACEDLLPPDLIWRKKAQFDEGSGTVAALDGALGAVSGLPAPIEREAEGALYERLLRDQYADPDLILRSAGRWVADRI